MATSTVRQFLDFLNDANAAGHDTWPVLFQDSEGKLYDVQGINTVGSSSQVFIIGEVQESPDD